jgi:GNAT superfamily N-acetyltransferase
MTIAYREAGSEDVPVLVRFQAEMARETEGIELDPQTLTRGVTGVFQDASRGQYYVGYEDSRMIACTLITYEWSDWRNGMVWWVQSVYVIPEARKRGVYKGLYAHVKDLAQRDPRVKGIRLYVDSGNTPAQLVYAKLGMNGDHYRVFEWMKTF